MVEGSSTCAAGAPGPGAGAVAAGTSGTGGTDVAGGRMTGPPTDTARPVGRTGDCVSCPLTERIGA